MTALLWSILTYLFFIISFLLAFVLIAHILMQKRTPSGTIAWLLIIVFLPYAGVPLYLFLGGRKMRRHASEKGELELPCDCDIPLDRATMIDRILRTYTLPGAEAGHTVTLCRTGMETFEAMESLLKSARRSIYLSTFIYHADDIGRHILDILVEKAAAGVDVRLMMDGVGSLHTPGRFFRPLVRAGGKVAVFLPVLHRPFRGRTNLRNHRKITVVDNQSVMAGGANIGREYMGPQHKDQWKDLAFVMKGHAVRHWLHVFARDWKFAAKETLTAEQLALPQIVYHPPMPMEDFQLPSSGVVQVIPSGPDVPGDALHDALLSMIYAAQYRFWAVTPYFVPNDALCQALLLAARRGVDVRVVLPRRSNHPLPDIVRGIPLRQIQQAGGLVMFYTPRMMHAKVVLMDEQAAVLGSANMDIRSLLLNYETAMFVYGRDDIRAVADYIEDLMTNSQCGIAEASLLRQLGESIVRLVSPLL
jgi:cardiolipin synthase